MKTISFNRLANEAIFLLIICYFCTLQSYGQEEPNTIASAYDYNSLEVSNKSLPGTKELVFISDIQQAIFIEKIFRSEEDNSEASEAMFRDIIRRNPEAVFMLGDIARFGFLQSEWSVIDIFDSQKTIRKSNIFAVPGNHEYMLFASRGIQNFCRRFPGQSLTGYVSIFDSIAVVMLNSNFSKMNSEEIRKQSDWYSDVLDKLEESDSVKAIVVCCHHSPFTRSMIVSSSKDVQKQFLDKFERNSKCKAFLSGHSHNLEHYRRNGKDYLVIGGGGGPSQPLFDSLQSSPEEIKENSGARFFYLMLQRSGDELLFKIRSYDSHTGKLKDWG